MKKQNIALITLFFLSLFSIFPETILPFKKWWDPAGLEVFKKAYPTIGFVSSFDSYENDWCIHIFVTDNETKKTKKTDLYWCESRFLPKDKISQKENYRPMLYKYPKKIPNPNTFTEEQIEYIKNFTTRENRQNGPIDAPFLFNAIYDVNDRTSTESHIKRINFLNRTINVHEKIEKPITNVSKKIMLLKDKDEFKQFFETLDRTDGFNWRSVRDTQSRSFHSIGLAIDILPKGYYQKVIYWGWQKQLHPESWWQTPLNSRWAPPKEIIDIFEEEGFIWGGKWIVWDNMHFEYHPELIIYNK